ncbi:CHAT domain-containing tetratricopeptide repeat protein [Nostoc sp.]|uniref:CHAT domain-containing tetratricopeptide repeat protein n=1 Tax=Nostoc sp. TaxID=1180 RepID=UPI002FF85792
MTSKNTVTQTKKDIAAIPLSRSLLIAQQPQAPTKPNSPKDQGLGLSSEEQQKLEQATPSVKANVNTAFARHQQLSDEAMKLFNQETGKSRRQAIAKWEELLKIWRQKDIRATIPKYAGFIEAAILHNIGSDYSLLGENQKALEYFNQGLVIQLEPKHGIVKGNILSGIASVYSGFGDKQKAVDYYNQALSVFQAEKQDSSAARTFNSIAQNYKDLGQAQEAIDFYNKALEIHKRNKELEQQASILQLIGVTYYDSLGDYQNALKFFNQALEIQRQRKDLLGQAEILSQIASIYNFSGDKRNALASLEEALQLQKTALVKLSEANNGLLTQSSVLSSIAATYVSLYDFQEALNYLNQARTLRQKIGDRGLEALALSSIAYVYSSLGEKQKELDSLNEALALNRAIRDSAAEAKSLNDIAGTYLSMGKPQQALDYHHKALDIQRRLKLRPEEAKTLKDMALVYSSLGDYKQSLKTSEQALKIFERLGDHNTEAITLNDMCNVSRKAQDYKQALDHCNFALKLSREQKYLSSEQNALVGLVKVYEISKDYPKALDNAKKVEVLASQQNDNFHKGVALFFLSRVYLASGEYQKALESSKEGLSAWHDMGFRLGEANSLDYLGKIYNALKQPQQAIDTYNKVLALRQKLADKAGQADTLYNLAVTERDRGNLQDALTQIQTTIAIVEGIRTKVTSEDLRTSYFATVQDYYKFYIDLLMQLHTKDPSQVCELNIQDFKIKDKCNALALHISERSRARSLVELLTEAHVNIRKGVDPKLVAEERRLQYRLEAQQKQLISLPLPDSKENEPKAAHLKAELENLLSQYRELQAKIRTTSPKYTNLRYPNPLTLPQIQQQLDKDTLLLQYSLGEEHSYLWAVTPNSMQSHELPGRKEIEQKVENLRKLLRDPGMNGVSPEQTAKAAAQLSQLILAPVAKDLGQKRLLIVADGALQYIPFTVLTVTPSSVNGENYQPLLINHEIVSLPSATTIDILRQELKGRQKAPKTIAVLADPVFSTTDERVTGVIKNPSPNKNDQPTTKTSQTAIELDKSALTRATRDINLGNIPRLKGTRNEAEEIMKIVPQSERLQAFDFDANYTWATNPQVSQYRYLLFATHGILNEINPELSGIVLSQVDKNGKQQQKSFLQLADLFNLDYPAELLVLSACETGLGKEVKGEGLVSLTRGLMYAGAARVVVSLWSVDDEPTSKLMSEFYKEILQEGKTPAAAMRAAQLTMWKQEEWRNPYSWAGFILQGEWR